MSQYRIRVLASDGITITNQLPDCSDDDAPMALAKSLNEGRGIAHLWAGDRNLGQIFLPLPTSEK